MFHYQLFYSVQLAFLVLESIFDGGFLKKNLIYCYFKKLCFCKKFLARFSYKQCLVGYETQGPSPSSQAESRARIFKFPIFSKLRSGLRVFPGLKIESLRLPKCCLGLSNNNLEGPTGLSKIVKELRF